MQAILRAVFALICCFSAARPQGLLVPAAGSPLRVPPRPQNLVAGDVNADGNIDLVTAHGKAKALGVFLGDGHGAFARAPGSPISLETAPGEMALADLDGDKKVDLSFVSHDSYGLWVLLGDGRGGFVHAPGSPFAASRGERPHTHGLALGDLNGDGALDAVTADNEDDNVSVLLGDGLGGFVRATGSPFPVARGPYPHALGDMDGDGTLDIVSPGAQADARNVAVLLGDGRGGFHPSPGSPASAASSPYFVALADVNGDGKLDAITTHDDRSVISVLLGDGRGGFVSSPRSTVDVGHRGWGVVPADFNRDGKLDLAVAADRAVRLLLGDGRGSFVAAPGSPYAAGPGAWRLAVADFNKDGRLDVATSNLGGESVSVLLGR